MVDQFQLPKDTTRVWDLLVPIVTKGQISDVYITEDISSPSDYAELCYLLASAESTQTFNFHINCLGGVIDSALMIINAIENSKAESVAYVYGTVASAATMIALACDELVVNDYTSFMIHNYSSQAEGGSKGGELKARQKHTDASLQDVFEKCYKHFLTSQEVVDVIDDKDIWLMPEEVKRRWAIKQAALGTR